MNTLAWLSSIVANRFRCKLKNLEFQTNGGSLTWYAPTATPLTPYFNPLHQPKTPVFTKKLTPKVLFFPHCPKFWKLFTQRPQISRKKGTQMPPIFMAFVTERPQFFALHASVWGECCSLQHGQKLENFVFLRQNRAIWWILLGANLIKVMKTKFQFYRLNLPNCYGRTSMEGRDDTQVIIPWSNTEGDISYNDPLYDSAPPGSLNNAKHTWSCASRGILSARCNAGPTEGPGKILKYRSNLRLYPVDFGNKLCILIFIILSIWPNFFDPPPIYCWKLFGPPLSATQNFFGPPSILPSPPPTKVFMNTP